MKDYFNTSFNSSFVTIRSQWVALSHALSIRFDQVLNREILYIIMGSLFLSLVIILTDGRMMPPMAILGMIVVIVITFYRLDWGFYIYFTLVILADQFAPPEFLDRLITYKFQYLQNVNTLTYLPTISAGVMTPMELHLGLLFSVWLLIGLAKQNLGLNRVDPWGLVILFFTALSAWLAFGIATGGVFVNGLWETRGMFYFVILIFFAPQIIQTKAHVKALMWILIFVLTYKSLQAWYIFVTLGNSSFDIIPAYTNHEDPVFIVLIFALGLGLFLMKGYRAQLAVIMLCLIPLIMGFHVGQRRAAFAACGTTLCVILVLLESKYRRKIMAFLMPILICFGMYLAIFWNSNSPVASFAQTIKSGFITEKNAISDEDYYSNLWRDIEKYNLAMTIRRVPILGVGYGNKYDEPIKLTADLWPLDGYIPHNMILDIIVKTGVIGFFIFWFVINGIAFYGATLYPKIRDPYLKAVCIVALAAIFNQMVVSYFDLQLTYTRNMVLLGTFVGVLTQLKKIDDRESPPAVQQQAA